SRVCQAPWRAPRNARHHHAVAAAGHARRLGLDVGAQRPQIKRPSAPAALAAVIAGSAPAAHPAATALLGGGPGVDDHGALVSEVDRLHDRARKTAQTSEYAARAHAATCLPRVPCLRRLGTLGAERRAPLLYVLSDPRNPQETRK
ncbi:MAG: hypothetical protein QOJ97_3007, partial [Solirubrobacteraceae bacterium]|nr:hypothetical protein [Solirubrobacteraceae bacterium]